MAGQTTSARGTFKRSIIGIASALSLLLAFNQNANAYDEPNLNLGFTSFLDGGLPAGAGFYAVEYLQFYTANKLTDQYGNSLGLPKSDIDALVSLTQFIYVSNLKVGSGSLGLDVIVPWVASANVDDGLGNSILKGRTGVGDLLIGPLIQFDPIMGANGPLFVQRIEFQVLAPTGLYDNTAAVQPGANFWSFDPYYAGTVFITPEWTASARIHYLWNGKNDDPNVSLHAVLPPGANLVSSQAGQAFHMNFATEYALTKELRIGLNGYYLQQTTDTLVNDIPVPGRKERVAAVGPGFMYSWGPEHTFFFNAYQEFGAENRPEGQRFTLRYVQHF